MEDVFIEYASFSSGGKEVTEMDGVKFTKLCKDSGIVDKKFTTTNVDIIFAKCHAKGARKISYAQFQQAVEMIAAEKGVGLDQIEQALLKCGKPKVAGTAAEAASVVDRLTDTSQYTGAHKERFDESGKGKGLAGRESTAKGVGHIPAKNIMGGPTKDLASVLDRSPADARGVKLSDGGAASSSSSGGSPPKSAAARPATASIQTASASNLKELFQSFCAIAGGSSSSELDGNKFAKLCKDCKLVGKDLTTTDVDIIFSKVKERTARKINYEQFLAALKLIAEKKKTTVDELEGVMLEAGGPLVTGTAVQDAGIVNKLTDTHLYTGAHKERFDDDGHGKGKAGRVQNTGAPDLSDITDRSPADVRGRKA